MRESDAGDTVWCAEEGEMLDSRNDADGSAEVVASGASSSLSGFTRGILWRR